MSPCPVVGELVDQRRLGCVDCVKSIGSCEAKQPRLPIARERADSPNRPADRRISLLAAFYGVCTGVYGIVNRKEPEFRFMVANAIKLPLLFLLTLAITFPSLYVFNALVRSRLGVAQLAQLLAAGLAVLLAVLASFGPIVAFFSITSTSYPFIVVLTVAIFLVAGGFGVHFLWHTLVKLTVPALPSQPVTAQRLETVWAVISRR